MEERAKKERKLSALMVNDFEASDLSEKDLGRIDEEVRGLADEELDKLLAVRLDLPYPVDAEVLDRALSRVEEPERLSERGASGIGAPDMSHEARPEERDG